ncbi:MAG TPA: ROK family protein [Mycobacteriales bacterium]|nr:ROK family protein [Mycobacteriales bacterium]
MSDWALAIDVGGTKLAAGRIRSDGTVHVRAQRPTPDTVDAEELWSALMSVVDDVLAGEQPEGIGVGCGGPMRWPAGDVSPLNIPAWRGFPLRQRLRERFPQAVVRVHNDAVAMAVGEHWRGAGRGSRHFLGIVVSTGVGGGLVLEDRIVSGGTGNAGHVGHVVVDADGPPCACGGKGCLEAIARGPAVVAWALAQGWAASEISGVALADAARDGDAIAIAAFTRAGRALGVGLASIAAALDLDAIAVGGGLAESGDLLLGPARAAFDRHAQLDYVRRCRVTSAELGTDAGLVGAAAFVLAADHYWPAGAD